MDFIRTHAEVVIHGGYMDRVLGPHLDKRIPHKDLPAVKCPVVDTTPIDETHDDEMFVIIDKLVNRPFQVDIKNLIAELCSLGAVVTGGRA